MDLWVGDRWFKEKLCYCSFKVTVFLFRYFFSLLFFFSFVKQEKYMWYCKKLKMWNFDGESEIKKKQYPRSPKKSKSVCCFCCFLFMGRGEWGSVRRATEWCLKMTEICDKNSLNGVRISLRTTMLTNSFFTEQQYVLQKPSVVASDHMSLLIKPLYLPKYIKITEFCPQFNFI